MCDNDRVARMKLGYKMEQAEHTTKKSAHTTHQHIQQLQWRDVRDDMHEVNPELTAIIDDIDPPDDCRLYKIKYNYGEEIVTKGQFTILENDSATGQYDERLLSQIRSDLNYNYGSNPFCIVLKKQIEVYLDLNNRTIPFFILGPGDSIGIWAAISQRCNQQPSFLWNISSGARSVFMLPKISDKVAHARLKKALNIKIDKPQYFMNHWSVFNDIAQNKEMVSPWHSEILAFSGNWFKQLEDPRWRPLHYYFLKCTWDGTEYFRNIYVWNTVFSYIVEHKQLRPNPYLHDTARHIFGIAVGGIPGFVPLTDDAVGPISDIQKIYNEIYRLKEAAPVIMGPANIKNSGSNPVYYSLTFPTSSDISPKSRLRSNVINEVNELNDLLQRYIAELGNDNYNLHHSLLHSISQGTVFKMIHTSPSNNRILPSKILPNIDDRFTTICDQYKPHHFPEKSRFWNGAVAIIPKPNDE